MDDCWESMGWKNYTLSFINILWPQQMLFQKQQFQMHFPQWIIYQIDMYKISLLSQNCPAVAQLVVIMRTSIATNDNKVGMVVSHFTLVSPGGARQYQLMPALHATQLSTLSAYWKRDCSPTHELDNIIVEWVLTHCVQVTSYGNMDLVHHWLR